MNINLEIAQKVLDTVDKGLVKGLGNRVPGHMCVEAAVCYALGLPHGDDPKCVAKSIRSLKIALNDKNWSSNKARAKGLRRLSLAQLGSLDIINDIEFAKNVSEMTIKKIVPIALRVAAKINKNITYKNNLLQAALKCEKEGTRQSALEAKHTAAAYAAAYAAYAAAYAAYAAADAAANAAAYAAADAAAYAAADAAAYAAADAAAYAAAYAAKDKILSEFAENIVQILIQMKTPGCQWLYLTEG